MTDSLGATGTLYHLSNLYYVNLWTSGRNSRYDSILCLYLCNRVDQSQLLCYAQKINITRYKLIYVHMYLVTSYLEGCQFKIN